MVLLGLCDGYHLIHGAILFLYHEARADPVHMVLQCLCAREEVGRLGVRSAPHRAKCQARGEGTRRGHFRALATTLDVICGIDVSGDQMPPQPLGPEVTKYVMVPMNAILEPNTTQSLKMESFWMVAKLNDRLLIGG